MSQTEPDDSPLSKYERNDLYRAIESNAIPVAQFQLAETMTKGLWFLSSPRRIIVIRHQMTGSFFCIEKKYDDSFQIWSQVGRNGSEEDALGPVWEFRPHLNRKWRVVQSKVESWALEAGELGKRIEQEHEKYEKTPDLWKELQRDKKFITSGAEENIENTPFTADEQAEISVQLKQIKEQIRTAGELTAEQMRRVETRLDEAEQASRRLGRKDWLAAFNGAVFSLILSDLIPQQTAQQVMILAVHGLGHLFGVGGPPLHLPPGG